MEPYGAGAEEGTTMNRWIKLALAAALLIVLGVGAAMWFAPPAEAKGPCRCPQIYAPVECDNGKTYPNQCVADCRNARNCTPVGVL